MNVNYTRHQRPALGLMLLRTALAVSSFSKMNKRKKARARANPSPGARARAPFVYVTSFFRAFASALITRATLS